MPIDRSYRFGCMKKPSASLLRGGRKTDLVVKNSTLVNVYSGELLDGKDVVVKDNRITSVDNAGGAISESAQVIDIDGRYLAPGFLDGHVHIEDSMGTITEFARVVLPRGTTGVFMDPHEIANVLGLEGVKLMVEEARKAPLRVYTCIPSCVPATSSEFETSGGCIGVKEVKEALGWEETIALGEVMDYLSVIGRDREVHSMIRETLKAGKVVEGHAPGLFGKKLDSYIAPGISSCHESTEKGEALEKLRRGMYLMIREGFASIKNLSNLIGIVTEKEVDSRQICLVTDDRHPKELITEGHMDHVVRKAVEEGVDPVKAIQMVSLNTAIHFRVDGDIGGIAPGKLADMIVLDDLTTISVRDVIADGRLVAHEGKLVAKLEPFRYPSRAKETVRIRKKLKPDDFKIQASIESGEAKARVIGVKDESARTRHLMKILPVSDGSFRQDPEQDIAKVCVVERHKGTGNVGKGFVKGFGFKEGAVASTIAHDSHNLLVVGIDDQDMAVAANKLADVGGGIVTARRGEIIGLIKLPIAGLMSDRPISKTYKKLEEVMGTWKKLGCQMSSPLPSLILLALPVLPELRITDKGMVDTVNFELVGVELKGQL